MIQGNTKPSGATSYKQTALGIITRTKLLALEIQGTKKGLEYIHDLIKDNKNIEITSQLICKIHEVSFKWIFPDWAGRFRNIQVTYSGKEAPSYFLVHELTKNLCDDLEKRLENLPKVAEIVFIDEIVHLLAWFQHQFVFIHPFQDYNGRIGRMLTVLILLKSGLPAIEIKVETNLDRQKYLEAMKSGDEGDLKPLEKLIGEALTIVLKKMGE
jgi:Fic family protein